MSEREWHDVTKSPVPMDGRMYRVRSATDRGVMWWSASTASYGYVEDGKELTATNITHWAEFET